MRKVIYLDSIRDFNQNIWLGLTSGHILGFVVRCFFNQQEIDLIKDFSHVELTKRFIPFSGYSAIPRPFNFVNDLNRQDYIEETSSFLQTLRKNGIEKTFQDRFHSLVVNDNTNLVLSGVENQNTFSETWCSLRILEVDQGEFPLHCGNFFRPFNAERFAELDNVAIPEEQLSYFIMIQKPESEVAIQVYDAHWNNLKVKVNEYTLATSEGETTDLRTIECSDIELNEGDLLVFNGGDFWHRVNSFSGSKQRITLGGFASFSNDRTEITLWA